jgi:Tfp pilus assembly protein PilX
MERQGENQHGYALVTAMIVLAVMLGLVAGLIEQVINEQKISGNDFDFNSAFYAAEAGLEQLNSDLSKLFSLTSFPSASQMAAVTAANRRPNIPSVTYPQYSVAGGQMTNLTSGINSTATTVNVVSTAGWPGSGYFMIDAEEFTYTGLTSSSFTGVLRGQNGSTAAAHSNNARVSRSKVVTIQEGPSAGLTAQVIPYALTVAAKAGIGSEALLTREIQVALIPVFQFGIFSDSDLSFFAGPNFNFGGRVHTNGNLFLTEGSGNTLTLSQKVVSAIDVIRTQLANTIAITTTGHTGTVNVIQSPGIYRNLQYSPNEGSVTGGAGSSINPSWAAISLSTYNGNIRNRDTGGKALVLPFVDASASPIEIIRRPPAGEDATGILGEGRLYNQASVRVLLSDAAANLPGGVGYPLNANLYVSPYDTPPYAYAPGTNTPRFAESDPADEDFLNSDNSDQTAAVSLIDGFLKVELVQADGTVTDVTKEILSTGISTSNAAAILRFQRLAPAATAGSSTATDFEPLKLFDPREGLFRDAALGSGDPRPVTKIGVMGLVEIDVNNLRLWLNDAHPSFSPTTAGSGNLAVNNNGYILYFSDRRGNRDGAGNETGEFGFEDFINGGGGTDGTPNNTLETGEDLNQDATLQTYGANLPGATTFPANTDLFSTYAGASTALSASMSSATNPANGSSISVTSTAAFPTRGYVVIGTEYVTYTGKTSTTFTGITRGAMGSTATSHGSGSNVFANNKARKNKVYYFRRALRLVNGSLNNLPMPGFTIASENPVYIQGHYNANSSGFGTGQSAAAVIADAVTLLSGAWRDQRSFDFPYAPGSRPATTTWYRAAIAGGKGLNFPNPAYGGAGVPNDFGTDGGVHNFLRYIESWSGQTLNYTGSLVSLYYSRQAAGSYKCCSTVYSPPTRAYSFDVSFLVPSQLPPGTPRFRDINNLSFRQTILAGP